MEGEDERVRRRRFLLLVVVLLMFMTFMTPPQPDKSKPEKPAPPHTTPINPQVQEQLESATRALRTKLRYPTDIDTTGVLAGVWEKAHNKSEPWVPEGLSIRTGTRNIDLPVAADFHSNGGVMRLSIMEASTWHIDGIQSVQAKLELIDGPSRTSHDMSVLIYGFYIESTGTFQFAGGMAGADLAIGLPKPAGRRAEQPSLISTEGRADIHPYTIWPTKSIDGSGAGSDRALDGETDKAIDTTSPARCSLIGQIQFAGQAARPEEDMVIPDPSKPKPEPHDQGEGDQTQEKDVPAAVNGTTSADVNGTSISAAVEKDSEPHARRMYEAVLRRLSTSEGRSSASKSKPSLTRMLVTSAVHTMSGLALPEQHAWNTVLKRVQAAGRLLTPKSLSGRVPAQPSGRKLRSEDEDLAEIADSGQGPMYSLTEPIRDAMAMGGSTGMALMREQMVRGGSGPHFRPITGFIVSPNCPELRVNVSAKMLVIDRERIEAKAILYALCMTAATVVQTVLVIRLFLAATTQSVATRLSNLTIGMQGVMDAYLCMLHLAGSVLFESLFSAFLTISFLKLVLFSILEMRMMLMVWKARMDSNDGSTWDNVRREIGALYARFYTALILGGVLVVQVVSLLPLFTLVLFSYWVPQIIHQIQHDVKPAMKRSYLWGMTCTRLFFSLYFLLCPANFIQYIYPYHVDATWSLTIVVWQLAQVLLLLSQDKYGPRWFIPRRFCPAKYNYHRQVVLCDNSAGPTPAETGQVPNAVVPEADLPQGAPTATDNNEGEETSAPASATNDPPAPASSNTAAPSTRLGRAAAGLSWFGHATRETLLDWRWMVVQRWRRHQGQRQYARVAARGSDEGPDGVGETDRFNQEADEMADMEEGLGTAQSRPYGRPTRDPPAYVRAHRDDDGVLQVDCVICLCPVDLPGRPEAAASSGGGGGAGEADGYMVTPCHHLFHGPCLTQWMGQKMECPVCRARLPQP